MGDAAFSLGRVFIYPNLLLLLNLELESSQLAVG